jgi:hypothetical protein
MCNVESLFVFFYMVIYILSPRVEAGCNKSTVTLRVAESDEEGTRCLGV